MIILWIGFLVLVAALLALDLGVLNRRPHVIGIRESLRWTGFWVALALLFNVLIYFIYENHWFDIGVEKPGEVAKSGMEAATMFLEGYLIEETLSLDNLFVIAVIIHFFRIPPAYQHRVLFWGILGAIIFRGIFIGIGALLVQKFDWIFYVFGLLLLYAAYKMIFLKDANTDPTKSIAYRCIQRFVPLVAGDFGGRFTTHIDGKRYFTSLLPAVVVIESTDVMFAIDSVPAIFIVTDDPFLVFTSNIFAILGLRSLYFLLAGALDRFHHLKTAVIVLLIFIATKMLLHHIWKPPQAYSLAFVGLCLAAGVIASLLSDRPAAHPPE